MKKKVIVTLFATLILFGFLNFVFVNFMGVPFFPLAITGHAVNDSGIVQIFIEENNNIFIYSPENRSYDFAKGAAYILALNVSADFIVDAWSYSLYDLRHNVWVEQNTPFVPNSSISAVRWENELTVFALSDIGQTFNSSVVFYVNVSNSAPLIGNITEPIFVCEGSGLRHRFNVTDIDEDNLDGDISPKNPFYLSFDSKVDAVSFFDIVSGTLRKGDVGIYNESLSVVDPWGESDNRDVEVEVIEINNPPVLENIGARTVWLTGEDSVFYYTVNVMDIEDGATEGGSLTFNLTWGGNENLFDIGVDDGILNYTPVLGHEGRVYSLQVCVEDNPLGVVHENISLCSPSSGASETVCDTFSLTVTDDNRAPEIVNFTPNVSIFGVAGLQSVEYFVEVYDADGTIPDIDWYVDGALREHNENMSEDSFAFSFACEISGAHSVRAITTDGLLNDSQTWSISVSEVECPIASAGGGGGGAGGTMTPYCAEDWFCDDWEVCQNVKRSFDSRVLSLEDYSVTRDTCSQNKEEDERFCGFQIKQCHDLNDCSNIKPIFTRPSERRFCYFTENPSCFDGITNCHDGGCEVLNDCGGPCGACASCSDGLKNQNEADVDCGGPCPFACEPEVPFAMISTVLIVVAVVLVIVILLILLRLFLLWIRQKDGE